MNTYLPYSLKILIMVIADSSIIISALLSSEGVNTAGLSLLNNRKPAVLIFSYLLQRTKEMMND